MGSGDDVVKRMPSPTFSSGPRMDDNHQRRVNLEVDATSGLKLSTEPSEAVIIPEVSCDNVSRQAQRAVLHSEHAGAAGIATLRGGPGNKTTSRLYEHPQDFYHNEGTQF